MGFKTEFNWALKLKPENGLDEAGLTEKKVFSFEKNEYRTYPVGIPIDLINGSWEAVAKVMVTEFTNKENRTIGKYKVLKIYEGEEKEFLTGYWRETVEHIKGRKIVDFSDIKVS